MFGFAWACANVSVEEGCIYVCSLCSLVDVSVPVKGAVDVDT